MKWVFAALVLITAYIFPAAGSALSQRGGATNQDIGKFLGGRAGH